MVINMPHLLSAYFYLHHYNSTLFHTFPLGSTTFQPRHTRALKAGYDYYFLPKAIPKQVVHL